jgi:hypothetical protein
MPRDHIEYSRPVGDQVAYTTCYMCACRCGIKVHLRDGTLRYIEGNRDHHATSWTDVDVSCEACHGPGSRHVAWAKSAAAKANAPDSSDRMGLTNWLKPTDNGHWEMNPETGIARRTEKLVSTELETCAACHSRRKLIVKNSMPGEPYLDAYLAALLEPGLYHADGQIDGEVYEYGSFLQSRLRTRL